MREEPEVAMRVVDVAPGDRFLVCSDGVWAALDPATLDRALDAADAASIAASLAEMEYRDDATVVVIVVSGTTT
jgi:serine/threonine protein phosphatase PrpC